jgi:selenoprotein W-related protein
VAAELKEAYSATTKLIEGSKGIFDVKVDGRLVYSKHQTQRFPEQGELTRLVGKG